jgi:hypothetical protein
VKGAVFKNNPCRELGEMSLYQPVTATRYEFISVSVPINEYISPKFQEWITHVLFTRIHPSKGMISIHIENDA